MHGQACLRARVGVNVCLRESVMRLRVYSMRVCGSARMRAPLRQCVCLCVRNRVFVRTRVYVSVLRWIART